MKKVLFKREGSKHCGWAYLGQDYAIFYSYAMPIGIVNYFHTTMIVNEDDSTRTTNEHRRGFLAKYNFKREFVDGNKMNELLAEIEDANGLRRGELTSINPF